MASDDEGVRSVFTTPEAQRDLAALSFSDQTLAWVCIFSLLADPFPDSVHKVESPFPWAYVTYRDTEFVVRYRLRKNGEPWGCVHLPRLVLSSLPPESTGGTSLSVRCGPQQKGLRGFATHSPFSCNLLGICNRAIKPPAHRVRLPDLR